MNAHPIPKLVVAIAGVLVLTAASGCGPADPLVDEPGASPSAVLVSDPEPSTAIPSLRVPRTTYRRDPADPAASLPWKRGGERGMTCAELAKCCPKLPAETQPSCGQIVALDDESLCSVVSSPYCEP
jgi:hypothetical protein